MKRSMLVFTLLLFTLFSCNKAYYRSASYDYFASQHRTIAILPVESLTYGRMPMLPPEEDLRSLEEAESRAFQVALYNEVASHVTRPYRHYAIDLQHYSQTNAKLKEAGISIRDSWHQSPEQMATLLGVDAVVRTTVEKERYLTDLESFGISVATTVAILFSESPWWIFLPDARTSDVRASCAIIDGRSGKTVWAIDRCEPTYWNRSNRIVVEDISRGIARRLPYRD